MKGLVLLSSGIDSPVAAYRMHKQLQLGLIHFSMQGKLSDRFRQMLGKLVDLCGEMELFSAEFVDVQRAFAAANTRLQCIYCKRMMLRIGERVAREHGYTHLVTGDNLGQVASQTMENMAVIDSVVSLPVLRPLISFDKNYTVDLARHTGLFEVVGKKESACPFLPERPVTRTSEEKIAGEEARLDIAGLVRETEVRAYQASELVVQD